MKTIWTVALAAGFASAVMAQNDDVLRAQADLQKLKAAVEGARAAADEAKKAVVFNWSTADFVSGQLVSGPPVKGAPYSAESVNETIQVLADGNRIVQRTTAMQYRDNEGRERREETSAMGAIFITDPVAATRYTLHPETRSAEKGPMPVLRVTANAARSVFQYSNGNPVTLKGTVSQMEWVNPTAWISLNVQEPDGKTVNWRCATASPNALVGLGWTRNSVKLNDAITIDGSRAVDGSNTCEANSVTLSSGTTTIPHAPTVTAVASPYGARVEEARIALSSVGGGAPQTFTITTGGRLATGSGNEKTEQLGNMFIGGVQAEGTRTTTTIPAGDIGNERPINIVDERWYSPDLQMTVMTKHSDPRSGETNFQLKNINRSNPPPTLFEIPSDYTVTGGGGRGGRVVIEQRK